MRRKRIARACNFCRHRKIKCDGEIPCLNCQQLNSQNCEYEATKTKNLRDNRKQKNKCLEDRLTKVENFLEVLSTQFQMNLSNLQNTPNNVPDSNQLSFINNFRSPSLPKFHNGESELGNVHIERFTGSHFHFCKHPMTFINLLKKKVPIDKHKLLIPFEKMPILFSESVKSYEDNWVETPLIDSNQRKQLLEGVFPKDHKFIIDLLQEFYIQDIWASFVCSVEELKELFAIYYDGLQSRKLKEPELLIMNMALVISISGKLDELNKLQYRKNIISDRSNNTIIGELKEIHDVCFSSSIFYYNRISLLNEGIQTVKAIMLLLIYTESNIANSRLDHGLLYLAVRYAQDIGLQEYNTYSKLPDVQIISRKRLWCAIEYFDMEMAHRKGRSLLIKMDDGFSECKSYEEHYFSDSDVFDLDYKFDYSQCFYEFTKALTSIRNYTYMNVVNSPTIKTFKSLHEKLKIIGAEMNNLILLYPFKYKPLLISNGNLNLNRLSRWINTGSRNIMERFSVLIAHISYVSHLMFINTIPSMYDIPDDDDGYRREYSEYKSNSEICCRTILEIAAILDRQIIPRSVLNTIIHHVVSAFLCLLFKCVTNPGQPKTPEDISLLLKVTKRFFSICTLDGIFDDEVNDSILSKEKKYELLCVITLNVCGRIIDLDLDSNVMEDNEEFNSHVDKLTLKFPSIFKKFIRNELIQHTSNMENMENDGQNYDHHSNNESESSSSFLKGDLYSTDATVSPDYNESINNGIKFWNYAQSMDDGISNVSNFFFDSSFGI